MNRIGILVSAVLLVCALGFLYLERGLGGLLVPAFAVASIALGLRSLLPALTLRSGLAVYAGGWCLGLTLLGSFPLPTPFLTWPIIFLAVGFVPPEGSTPSQTDPKTSSGRDHAPGESRARRLLQAGGKGNALLAVTAFAVSLWVTSASALVMPFWYPIDIIMTTATGLYAVFLMLGHGGLFRSRVSRLLAKCGLVIAVLIVPGGLASLSEEYADGEYLANQKRPLAPVVGYIRDQQRTTGTPPASIATALEGTKPKNSWACVFYQVADGEFALAIRVRAKYSPDSARMMSYNSRSAVWTTRHPEKTYLEVRKGQKVSERKYCPYDGGWNEGPAEERESR